jgi:hypothetical protein
MFEEVILPSGLTEVSPLLRDFLKRNFARLSSIAKLQGVHAASSSLVEET